ncbi:MAG: HAD family hydrolase [Balneolales bacterium]
MARLLTGCTCAEIRKNSIKAILANPNWHTSRSGRILRLNFHPQTANTLKNIKFIYFDLDDTLLDHRSAQKRALEELHLNSAILKDTSSHIFLETYNRVNDQLWQDFRSSLIDRHELQRLRFELTLKELELETSFHAELGDYYRKSYQSGWSWIEGAEAFYNEISKVYDVGLLTNGFSETQQKKIRQFDFNKTSRHIVISEDIGYLKPDSRIFDYATKLTGLNPDQILYVGDSYQSDIIGGSQFGWKTAWFTGNPEAGQMNTADVIFNDFSQLQRLLINE